MILYFLYAILVIVSLAAFSLFVTVFRLGVPPMPSSPGMRETMGDAVGEYPFRKIVDLGSGWGGLSAAVARRYPDRRVIGYEASLVPYLYSRLRYGGNRGAENLRFRRHDFRELEPAGETIYLAYLSPAAMEQLRRRFEATLPDNAVLVSALFGIRSWRATTERVARDRQRTKVFTYEIR